MDASLSHGFASSDQRQGAVASEGTFEQKRLAAWRRVRNAVWSGRVVGFALGVGFCLYLNLIYAWPLVLFVGVYCAIKAGAMARDWAMPAVDAALEAFRADAIGAAAESQGFAHRSTGFEPGALQAFIDAGLINKSWDKVVFRDEVIGEFAGRRVESWGIFGEEKNLKITLKGTRIGTKSEWETSIRARAYVIEWDRRFKGRTYLYRESDLRGPPDGAFPIGVSEPRFERAFRLFTTDGVEGHYLFDPLVVEKFNALEESCEGCDIRGALIGGKLLLLVERYEGLIHIDPAEPFETAELAERIDEALSSDFGVLRPIL
jgi:hypothetical protein